MRALTLKIQEISNIGEIAKALGMSVVISLFAKVAIYTPFTPVPFVFQNILCLLMGITMGKKTGALTVFFFLMQGICGLPVFAGGGSVLYLFGPTGGYLMGFLVGAYVAGMVYEKKKDIMGIFLALIAGSSVIFSFGFAWLSLLIGVKSAFLLGVVPFLWVEFLKVGLFAKGFQYIKKSYTK